MKILLLRTFTKTLMFCLSNTKPLDDAKVKHAEQ